VLEIWVVYCLIFGIEGTENLGDMEHVNELRKETSNIDTKKSLVDYYA
jgi:hypothetical protein